MLTGSQTPETSTTETDSMEVVAPADTMEAETPVGDSMEPETQVDGSMIEIEMSNFEYSVSEIRASAGDTLNIKLTNVEGMHDFDIDELGLDTEVIETGTESIVEFTIPADATPGTEYAYYCSVGNHRAQGMEGVIIVQ